MTKILVGVPTQEYARRADFYDYYNALIRPDGTYCMFVHGQSPAESRNKMIQAALDNDCTHVFFLDDDMAFEPDVLVKLIAHDIDVVSGLYLMRKFPHIPVLFSEEMADGQCKFKSLEYERETGLIEVANCGFGIVLIKTDVFRNLGSSMWITLGELHKDAWCDDIPFFNKVRKIGYKVHCDLTVTAGHMASTTIYPVFIDGRWQTQYRFPEGGVSIPAAVIRGDQILLS